MHTGAVRALSLVSLVAGLGLYLAGVAGLLAAKAIPPADVGLVSTAGTFAVLGLLGLLLARSGAAAPSA